MWLLEWVNSCWTYAFAGIVTICFAVMAVRRNRMVKQADDSNKSAHEELNKALTRSKYEAWRMYGELVEVDRILKRESRHVDQQHR